MPTAQRLLTELLETADVRVNGERPWDIQVHDQRLFGRVLSRKSLGLGEAYMDGWWDCPRIDQLVEHLMRARLERSIKGSPRLLLSLLPKRFLNLQSRSGAKRVAQEHYNLDNELFLSFLDPYNQYSCGMFENGCSLEDAQRNKLDLTCRKLDLQPDDRLLDIGCGWGGLARYAAETVGCRVTGINISAEQIRHARETCQGLPVDIRECDYRDLEGEFDKVVSVGMFEHVGRKNYRTFMETVDRLMNCRGIFLLHTIGSNHTGRTGTNQDPWIEKYIFPRGMLPSIAQIARAAEDLFVMEDWHNLGTNYAKTLHAWYQRFQKAWPKHACRYARRHGERAQRMGRMFEFYLMSCAGAFQARAIQVWQIVFTKVGRDQPECRAHMDRPSA